MIARKSHYYRFAAKAAPTHLKTRIVGAALATIAAVKLPGARLLVGIKHCDVRLR